jgi:glycosyltransferase involved in cell wall biosynthesis
MFSVVIPLFDKRDYFQRALDSVYAQSLDPAAVPEIIVVNDGSTDGGDAVARAQADRRVRVIDQPNRGVSAARNAGIAAAGQPFIAFLDADDRWQPAFLSRMRDLIAKWPGGVLYGSGFTTVRDGRPEQTHGIRAADLEEPPADRGGPVAGRVDYFHAARREIVTHPSCMVVPKSAAIGVGGFAEGVTHCEDYLFWTKLALAGPVVLTAEPLAEYDVAVPGQAVEFWTRGYRERFDILEFHRFLAAELGRRTNGGDRAADRSFAAYARGELRTALLQRLYWGNFAAADRLWRELALADLGLGPVAATAAWVSRHPAVHPPAGLALAAVRGLRAAARRR